MIYPIDKVYKAISYENSKEVKVSDELTLYYPQKLGEEYDGFIIPDKTSRHDMVVFEATVVLGSNKLVVGKYEPSFPVKFDADLAKELISHLDHPTQPFKEDGTVWVKAKKLSAEDLSKFASQSSVVVRFTLPLWQRCNESTATEGISFSLIDIKPYAPTKTSTSLKRKTKSVATQTE